MEGISEQTEILFSSLVVAQKAKKENHVFGDP